MQPDQVALLVETGGHPALRDRAEEVVRLILFAAPDQLDRDAGRQLLGDLDRLADVVLGAAAPAEAAAEVDAVDLALGKRHAGGLRQRRDRSLEVLARYPRLGLVAREPHGGVH